MAYQRLVPGSGVYQEGTSAQRLVPGSGVYQEAVSSGYTLTASVGAFTLTGNATGLKAARKLVGTTNSYALTGNAAGLRRGMRLAASVGAFTLTGVAAGLRAARVLQASVGTYALTGNAAGLTYAPITGYTLTAGVGEFTLTGVDAQLTKGSRAGGSYDAKKVVIRKGKRLLAFRSYAEAIAALEDGQAIEASAGPVEGAVEPPKPVQTVEVREVRRLAQRFDRAAEYQRLIDSAQYTELLVLYERLRAEQQDDEDVELLLLA